MRSDALTRLEVGVQVKPNATRLEGRVTSMLLAALPTSIKSDIIANRKLTAASITLEVMKRFQPGGLGEKSGLLRALTAPETATSPADGVEKLRLWSRNVARAVELGVTLPDPVLQIGALDSICRQILNKEPQGAILEALEQLGHYNTTKCGDKIRSTAAGGVNYGCVGRRL